MSLPAFFGTESLLGHQGSFRATKKLRELLRCSHHQGAPQTRLLASCTGSLWGSSPLPYGGGEQPFLPRGPLCPRGHSDTPSSLRAPFEDKASQGDLHRARDGHKCPSKAYSAWGGGGECALCEVLRDRLPQSSPPPGEQPPFRVNTPAPPLKLCTSRGHARGQEGLQWGLGRGDPWARV